MLTESSEEKKQQLKKTQPLKTHRGDRRIRVYDYMPYENRKSGSIDILWPLYSYNILISGRKTGRENVLEHIVYRMLKVKNGNLEAVSKVLCLERDLVEFIVSKLKEQGFVGEDNKVKEDAVSPEHTVEEDDSYISVKVFKDISDNNGYILPFVVINDDHIVLKNVKEQYPDRVVYAYDNEESKIINAYRIPTDGDVSKEINPKEIIKAVKDYLKQCRNNLNELFDSKRVVLDRIISGGFSDQQEPEIVYLHLSAVIEKNMFNVMISDFQGKGFYYELSKKVNNNLGASNDNEKDRYAWLKQFKESQVNNTSMYSEIRKEYSIFKEYDSKKYFKDALLLRDGVKQTVELIDDINEKDERIKRIINNLYRSIECALAELYKMYYNEDLIHAIKIGSQKACRTLVSRISESHSLNLAEEEIGFFRISRYIFSNIEQQPEMQCLLFLNLFEAHNAPDHPFLRLFKSKLLVAPISFIVSLKKYRDEYSHESYADMLDLDKLDSFIKKTRLILEILDPKLKDVSKDGSVQNDNLFKSDDYVVRARIFLDEKMGSGFLQNIDQNYAERILNLTKRYFLVLGSKNENDRKQYTSEYFDDMYKFFEGVFRDKVRTCRKSEEEISEFLKNGIKDRFGIELSLDGPLATVRTSGVCTVLAGHGFSLNAITVALLFSSDEGLMKDFLKHCDSYDVKFIDFMEEVIRNRGHGSNVNIDVSDKDFYQINRKFLFIFKSFVEFFK